MCLQQGLPVTMLWPLLWHYSRQITTQNGPSCSSAAPEPLSPTPNKPPQYPYPWRAGAAAAGLPKNKKKAGPCVQAPHWKGSSGLLKSGHSRFRCREGRFLAESWSSTYIGPNTEEISAARHRPPACPMARVPVTPNAHHTEHTHYPSFLRYP